MGNIAARTLYMSECSFLTESCLADFLRNFVMEILIETTIDDAYSTYLVPWQKLVLCSSLQL